MTTAIASPAHEPSEMNTTPLIDVLLVLLIMFIMTIPIATHSLEFPLPSIDPPTRLKIDPVKNRVTVSGQDEIFWNDAEVSEAQLGSLLGAAARRRPEPQLQLAPEAARVLDANPLVTLGGIPLADDDVLYVGVTPFTAGLFQLALRIPEGTTPGNKQVVLTVHGKSTPLGPVIPIGGP